jgi:PAS domain S-box-containing protein
MRKLLWVVGGAVLLIAILGWLRFGRPTVAPRVYKIGWGSSPPFQVRGADGQPTGLAVDLVRTAALRRGIRLEWVYWEDTSESALRGKHVDLWPIIAITPERLQQFHISEPFLEAEYCLLVRDDSPYSKPQDLAAATIGLTASPIDSYHLEHHLPQARRMPQPVRRLVMEDLCQQRTEAAFMDAFTGVATLLEKQGSCGQQKLRWIGAPEIRSPFGIGAPFESRAVADALRDEIGAMAAEGKLAPILGQWGYMSQQLVSMEALLDAKRHAERLAATAVLFGFLFVAACLQSVRILRERNRTRHTQQALSESERRFRGLLEHVQLAAAIFDIHGNYVFVNDYTLAITGWTRDEMMGHNAAEFLPPEQREGIRKLSERLAETGEPGHWVSERAVLTKDGKSRWLQVNSVALRDAAGKVVAVASLGADLTEHRALQEQYLQSQKLESLGTLAGGVAHDFNNLLTVINGYSDIVLRRLGDRDAVRPKIDQIRKAGARAAELTQQLLAFSRRQITQPRAVDLNGLLEESRAMFRTLLGDDIELAVNLSRPLGQVMADPGQMHQVLMNLLANARDAMPGGGKVTIETKNVTIPDGYQAEHPEAAPGLSVVLAVSDTGSGLDEHTRMHLFEPFFTTKGPGKGTGLGLSTVYGIVKQSDGWIEVDSAVGHGTTFRIHLPRIDREHAAVEEKAPSAAERGHNETVLVVEDQEGVRGLATEVLESLGYRVLSAGDGPEALALVAGHEGSIDLALTDVVLPGINGKQLVERLKALHPESKVLFTSGYSEELIAHRGVLDPDVAYIAKPYSPEDLAAKIREVLGG